MAKRRMIHTKISLSEQVNDMSEFAQLLFTWMIPHADDFGRLSGEPRVVKALVLPMSSRKADEIEAALGEMMGAGLVAWYGSDDGRVLQILKFDDHQSGLHKRTKSEYPPPPGQDDQLDATEEDVEDIICGALEDGTLCISETPLIEIRRQYRIGNLYIDILCRDSEGRLYIFEVKRQRLSASALEQVGRYADLIAEDGTSRPTVFLIGFGLTHSLDLGAAEEMSVNVVTYDESLKWSQLTLCDVKYRWITSERTKQKGTELEQEDSSTKTRKRDERLDHWAIKCYQHVARKHVEIALRERWIAFAEKEYRQAEDEQKFAAMEADLQDFMARGWYKGNIAWFMEWVEEGKPEKWKGGTRGRTTSKRREAGQLSDADREFYERLEAS